MDIWVLTAWSYNGELMNEVLSLLFAEDLVMPKVQELFDCNPRIESVHVEIWKREDGTWDASYYDTKDFYRQNMVG